MSSTFLHGFAQAVVTKLVADNLLECVAQEQPSVVVFVATELARPGKGRSLISSLERALLACPSVDELYADFDAIKRAVDALGALPER